MRIVWNRGKRFGAMFFAVLIFLLGMFDCMEVKAAGEVTTLEYDSQEMLVRGAIIWPMEDTVLCNNQGKTIIEIPAGTPLKALFEADGYFKVFYKKKIGLIDSSICMINLPDIMPDEMQYDITNSYSSIYKIHGYDIEGVTGEVLYPYVKVDEDEYLVPLLYPVALKLYDAEMDALKQGYTLKVYDAYRPYAVTKEIFARTLQFITDNPIYGDYMTEPVAGVCYGPNNFLAKSVSNHNYGVAVDITLVSLESGEELQMQAPMHELSTRSVLTLNNENADKLAEIMTSNGFRGLASEWWHFEIRECRKSYAAFQVKPLEK